MKKWIALVAAAVLMAVAAVPAAADIIVEPEGMFYHAHRDECDYVGRSYLVNGAEGYAAVYSAPDSRVAEYISNGETLYISHRWVDRKDAKKAEWGATQDGRWMRMSELEPIYDWQAFEDDFSDAFRAYDGTGGAITKACLYSYPGGVYVWTWDLGQDFSEAFTHVYVDESGRSWGFIGYYMGRHNQWVCLDDPVNEDLGIEKYLSVRQVRGRQPLIAPAEKLPAPPALWLIPAVLVLAVAVVTAILVRRRKKAA